MAEMTNIQVAKTIEATVTNIMHDIFLPEIKRQVRDEMRNEINQAVFKKLNQMSPNLISEHIKKAIQDMILNQLEIKIEVTQK